MGKKQNLRLVFVGIVLSVCGVSLSSMLDDLYIILTPFTNIHPAYAIIPSTATFHFILFTGLMFTLIWFKRIENWIFKIQKEQLKFIGYLSLGFYATSFAAIAFRKQMVADYLDLPNLSHSLGELEVIAAVLKLLNIGLLVWLYISILKEPPISPPFPNEGGQE